MNQETEVLMHNNHREYHSTGDNGDDNEETDVKSSGGNTNNSFGRIHDNDCFAEDINDSLKKLDIIDVEKIIGDADNTKKLDIIDVEKIIGDADNTLAYRLPGKLPGYYKHKHWASNFLNVTLLFHNGRELKMLARMPEDNRDKFWSGCILMVCISILLQIAVGILLTIGSFYKVRLVKELKTATRISNIVTVLVLTTTIIDVLLVSFNYDTFDPTPTRSPYPPHHY